ncbi:MAG: hypothetical protein RMM28_11125 [Thermoleophilia bacterium]|nr:hypothetical protein [Thermoleophilia bacterium]
MTQWLIEEAAFAALEISEALERSGRADELREQARLQERYEELQRLKEQIA